MIDFHCHVDLYPDPHAIARECRERKLNVLSVTTTPSAWAGTSALGGGAIITALGLHPQLAHERKGELPLFDRILPGSAYVGEVGLDGASEFKTHWQDQIDVFRHILGACTEAGGRVMSIHSRRASTPVLDLLELYPESGTPILHWFTGTARELDRAISLGCWFSVGPAMLRSKRGKDLVMRMPRERVLTESDGPFAQIKERSIFPWEVNLAEAKLADLWDSDPGSTGQLLSENLNILLSIGR
ncbi:TatD-related deoxyribonuclease [Nitrosococcus oceani ATCC 19707]|uniref:TatD-related deoxyribonuclease n=1 Tax=Nitrosococcus oceani (strain ATCC 19707 / BCRC 17464 / JCM 30415 / NCIMB 11848 / C-107) TaxID=323261 RepID=Q3JDB3_NITOC|nr:Qat anti-phage system TatD family nuclease QatD [Nitrosococcus oceani]ABA57183.1 TatD-related deoxyribonuclease [Nitrosococcus oceani ATCC 19707]GEM21500.1 TatD family hydrolase [Nitrosococcus oceani]